MLHNRPRALVSFGFGGKLVACFPRRKLNVNLSESSNVVNYSVGSVSIFPITKAVNHTEEYRAYSTFPGPLATQCTKKSELIKLATQRAKSADDEAQSLIWHFLRLHLETDGVADKLGPQLSDLLMGSEVANVDTFTPAPIRDDFETNSILSQIQTLLVSGKRAEACQLAVAHALWDHAMVISSHLDWNTCHEVIYKFIQATAPVGAPIRTLYTVLAGRTNDFANNVEILGRWKENLAIILANKPKDSTTALLRLGDVLARNGNKSALQFCTLLADSSKLDEFADPEAKLLLVGASLQTGELISASAVQMTELLEMAKRQLNPMFTFPQLQVYKFVYATQLADMGLLNKAYDYCRSIQKSITDQKNAYKYSKTFAQQFQEFSSRLEPLVRYVQLHNRYQLTFIALVTKRMILVAVGWIFSPEPFQR